MVIEAIAEAIIKQWPNLNISHSDTRIKIYYPIHKSTDIESTFRPIWVGSIHIEGDTIKLHIIRSICTYENVLSDPSSLDELYTILATHIEDIRLLIPKEWREPRPLHEPTRMEIEANRICAAMRLIHKTTTTKLQLRKWGQ